MFEKRKADTLFKQGFGLMAETKRITISLYEVALFFPPKIVSNSNFYVTIIFAVLRDKDVFETLRRLPVD
jgi:hypothetical protein